MSPNNILKSQMIHLLISKVLLLLNRPPKKATIMHLVILILILSQNQRQSHQLLKFKNKMLSHQVIYQTLVMEKHPKLKIYLLMTSKQIHFKQKARTDLMTSYKVLNKMSQIFWMRINFQLMLMLIEIIILIYKEMIKLQINILEMVFSHKSNSLKIRQ